MHKPMPSSFGLCCARCVRQVKLPRATSETEENSEADAEEDLEPETEPEDVVSAKT